jgi:hypothetical protein
MKGRPQPPFFIHAPDSVSAPQFHPRAESGVLAVATQLLAALTKPQRHHQRRTIGAGRAEG